MMKYIFIDIIIFLLISADESRLLKERVKRDNVNKRKNSNPSTKINNVNGEVNYLNKVEEKIKEKNNLEKTVLL